MSDDETKTEELPEAQQRANAFMADYGELVKKYNVDFAAYPVWVPDGEGKGGFRCIVQTTPIDITNQPVKTPFVA